MMPPTDLACIGRSKQRSSKKPRRTTGERGSCASRKARDRRWSPRQESNLYLALRRHLFYPLNYGEDPLSGR